MERVYLMLGSEFWIYFVNELMILSFLNKKNCKWFSFMFFIRYYFLENIEFLRFYFDVFKYIKGYIVLGNVFL